MEESDRGFRLLGNHRFEIGIRSSIQLSAQLYSPLEGEDVVRYVVVNLETKYRGVTGTNLSFELEANQADELQEMGELLLEAAEELRK